MNLKEIRKLFVEHSGRYDLVEDTADWEDNGADFFINQGQKILDRKADIGDSNAIVEVTLKANTSLLRLDNCSIIKEVFFFKEGETIFLSEIPFIEFKTKYDGNSDTGEPKHYTRTVLRNERANKGAIKFKGILFAPLPTKDYKMNIKGSFCSPELKEKSDYSYWSVEHPMTLVHAAMYAVESFYRNSQGMQDQMNAIMETIRELNFDHVEAEVQQYNKMRDSFNESQRYLKYKRD